MAGENEGLKERWERLTERERLSVGALAAGAVCMLLGVAGFVIWSDMRVLEDENAAIRSALKDIDANRESYIKAKAKASQAESRLSAQGVQMEGLLETAAQQSEVQIAEMTGRQPTTVAKKFTEKAVDVHIRKVTLPQLSNFLKRIETGPYLVLVTEMNVHTLDDKHEDLGVDLKVSTWERKPPEKKERDAKGDGASSGKGGKG